MDSILMPAALMIDHAKIMPGPAIARPVGEDGAINPLGLGQPARLLILQGGCHAVIIHHRERGYRQWRILG
jgi:hypothetical protein